VVVVSAVAVVVAAAAAVVAPGEEVSLRLPQHTAGFARMR
jgi:hypothetical protein